MPPCGWQENVLKGHNPDVAWPLSLFPHPFPEAMRTEHIRTVDEEVELNRLFIDRACAVGVGHVSLIWHPWSLHRFDAEMTMLERTFEHVKGRGLPRSTFAGYVESL